MSDASLLERAMSDNQDDWPRLSYSQLQVWDRCEFSWYLNYDQKWVRKVTSASLNIGTIAHRLLEIHYNNVSAGGTMHLIDEELTRLVNVAMDDPSAGTTVLPEISRAGTIVKRYIKDFAPTKDAGMQIMGVEKHFDVPMKTPLGYNFFLQGYVDLLVSIKGKVWIGDHKTTSNAAFWKPGEVQMDPQMTLYQAALRSLGIPVFGIFYNFLNSYEYKKPVMELDKLFKREDSYRSEKEIDNFVHQLMLEVQNLLIASSNPDYEFYRSLRRDCDKCGYREPCIIGLKGIDMEPILITKFQKKESREPIIPSQQFKGQL